jgi:hypothetical protein
MTIGEAGRRRLQTDKFATIDISFFVQLGAPANAFDENGILDDDQLIEPGWTIDDNAESFDPPSDPVEHTEQPE